MRICSYDVHSSCPSICLLLLSTRALVVTSSLLENFITHTTAARHPSQHADHSGGNVELARQFPKLRIFGSAYEECPAVTEQVKGGDSFDLGSFKVMRTKCARCCAAKLSPHVKEREKGQGFLPFTLSIHASQHSCSLLALLPLFCMASVSIFLGARGMPSVIRLPPIGSLRAF